MMKPALILLTLCLCAATAAHAHDAPPRLQRDYYRGYTYRIDTDGDTITVLMLNEITCYPPLVFKNKKQEQHYWRTVRDVRLTLPYAKLIAETLLETYEYIETLPPDERQPYLKRMEKALYEQYKPALRRFSKSQARVLVKLIQRETNQSSYDIIRAFMGSLRATFWQGFGRLCGVSLKSKYSPATNSDDALLDRIATGVEQGTL